MSAPLSPSNADLATTSNPSPSNLKSAGNALPNPSSQSDTLTAAENVVTFPGEHASEQATRADTQDHPLSFCTEDEKNEIKEDLSQHLEAEDKEGSRTKSGKALNDQGKRASPTTDYSWKNEEARRRREQARIRDAKSARVLQQSQSSWSPAARNKSPCFVLFLGLQRDFCIGCLRVIGLMQRPSVRVCPSCKRSFVREWYRVPL